jgi:hypothetical protein
MIDSAIEEESAEDEASEEKRKFHDSVLRPELLAKF